MNASEVTQILGLMATYDHRKTAETDIAAWSMVIGKYEFADARDAVIAHYSASAERIMPADIIRFAKGREDERRYRDREPGTLGEEVESDIPDADPDDVAAYLKALREGRTRTYDDGTVKARPMRALLSRVFQSSPPGDEK